MPPEGKRSEAEIRAWLVDYIAREAQVSPSEIDVNAPLESFALDSSTAIGMTGDLEEWLGTSVDPTVVFDYPTIAELSAYLADAQ